MPDDTKIATCCYCGTRAALVLRGETRHELACRSCGAPLHDLKQLRRDRSDSDRTPSRPSRPRARPAGYGPDRGRRHEKPMPQRRRPRKSRGRRVLSEILDLIEDVFD